MMDYRTLLLKYIVFVGEEEGTDFIQEWRRPPGEFFDDEWIELELLASEADSF